MPGARDGEELLGLGRGREEPPPLREGHGGVAIAVQDEERHPQPADLGQIVVARAQQAADGKEREHATGHVGDRRERSLEDERPRRHFERELQRDRGAERLAEDDEVAGGDAARRAQVAMGGPRVPVRALLVRRALAEPVTAVVEEEDVGLQLGVHQHGPVQSVADVAGVAVADEHREA